MTAALHMRVNSTHSDARRPRSRAPTYRPLSRYYAVFMALWCAHVARMPRSFRVP
jgi:hypothetical protein